MLQNGTRGVPQCIVWHVALTLLSSAIVLGPPNAVTAASIFPSAAPDYYQCQAVLPPFIATHIYVLASGYPFLSTDPPVARQGIRGAEFRIEGLPADHFIVNVEPGLGGTLEGDFFGVGGRITFPACYPWQMTSCIAILLDITVIPLSQAMDGTIVIRPLEPTCDAGADWLSVELCDAPTTTELCAPTTGMCFNSTSYCIYCPLSSAAGECTLPVGKTTWAEVKALFR